MGFRLATALLLVLLMPAAGAAQTAKTTAAETETVKDTQLAEHYYRLGEQLYGRADYEGAIAQFRKSYAHSKLSGLLYNIGRCHESLGQHAEAVTIYERFLESKPKNVTIIRTRIANLKKIIAKNKKATPKEPLTPPSTKPAGPVDPTPRPTVTDPTPRPTVTDPTPRPTEPSRPLRTTGLVLVATGGAALVGGIVLGALAKKKEGELEETAKALDTDYAAVQDDESTGRHLNTAAIVSLAAGGAVLATGAVLWLLDRRSNSKEKRAWLLPTVGPNGGGLMARFVLE